MNYRALALVMLIVAIACFLGSLVSFRDFGLWDIRTAGFSVGVLGSLFLAGLSGFSANADEEIERASYHG